MACYASSICSVSSIWLVLIPFFRCHPIMCVRKQMICWQHKHKKLFLKTSRENFADPPLYETTQNQKHFFCSNKNSHSADVHMYTCSKTHTQGLVSIFRTSLGIWCLNLEGHFVKQISACWKTIKTCCPCVSISVRVCVGGFISFFWTLRVCAEGGCFNFVIFLYER